MEVISTQWLIAIAIALISLEAIVLSFFLLPIGLGFLFVSILNTFIKFSDFYEQTAVSMVIGGTIFILFRKKFLEYINKSNSDKEEHIHKGGIGVIEDNSIRFEGTFWSCNSDISKYKNGDKVNIIIKDNKAIIIED